MATLTFSDLQWALRADGSFEASVKNAFDFGYLSPTAFVTPGSVPVNTKQSFIYSSTPSVAGIFKFDIVWGDAPGGITPGLGYFSGSTSSGREEGVFFPFNLGGFFIPFRFDENKSALAGAWTISAVPEPGNVALLGVGLTGLLAWTSRQRRAAAA